MKYSIVIPAYNEESNLRVLLPEIKKLMADEVIIVDDHSKDKTSEVAKSFGFQVIRNAQNLGKGGALARGFEAASNDVVVMLDADNSHIPADVPLLVEPLKDKKIGLVQASRSLGGSAEYTFFRAIGNILLTNICNISLGIHMTDALNGFKAMRR